MNVCSLSLVCVKWQHTEGTMLEYNCNSWCSTSHAALCLKKSDKLQISLSRLATTVHPNYSFDYPHIKRIFKHRRNALESCIKTPQYKDNTANIHRPFFYNAKHFGWVICHCHFAPKVIMLSFQFAICNIHFQSDKGRFMTNKA